MSGFTNSTSTDTINPGGFINTTTALGVSSSTLPVDVNIINSMPAGTEFVGYFGIQTSLPTGSNTIGKVQIDGSTVVTLANGQQVSLSAALPAGANNIGIVSLANGTQVALAAGTSVQLAAGAAHIGAVSIDSTVTVTGTVTLGAGSATVGNVGINAGVAHIGQVSLDAALPTGSNTIGTVNLAPGTSVAVTGVTLSNVGINAGTNAIGTVALNSAIPTGSNTIGGVTIAAALPTGTNSIGTIGLNAGTNTIGKVDINAGTNLIGKVDAQGVDKNGTKRQISTDQQGSIVPPTVDVVQTLVNLTANANTQLLAANPDRLMWMVQLTSVDNVLVNEQGTTLVNMNSAGTLIYAGGVIGAIYTPVLSGTSLITGMCAQTATVRVTEYTRK